MGIIRELIKGTIGVCSGGFDPIHPGHISMIKEAKQNCDYLIVIVNNDNWLKSKKGYTFMTENDRLYIVDHIVGVDATILTSHSIDDPDRSVCKELEKIRPDIFFNGGDRLEDNIPEYQLCKKLGIKMVFNTGGGKIRSSSELTKKIIEELHLEQAKKAK